MFIIFRLWFVQTTLKELSLELACRLTLELAYRLTVLVKKLQNL